MAAKGDLFSRYRNKPLFVSPQPLTASEYPMVVSHGRHVHVIQKNYFFILRCLIDKKSCGYNGRVQPGPRLTVSHGALTDNR